MKQRQSKPEQLLKLLLDLVYCCPSAVRSVCVGRAYSASRFRSTKRDCGRAVDRRSIRRSQLSISACARKRGLHAHIVLSKRKHRYQIRPSHPTTVSSSSSRPLTRSLHSPLPHRNLNKPQPLPQRQIVRPRMRRQTLRRASHDDNNSTSSAFTEDVGAGSFGDGADAEEEEEVAVDGDFEVGCWQD